MAERARTERPPFDVERYARESEARIEITPDSRRDTVPPPPEHTNLRESCRDLRAAIAQQPGEHPASDASIATTPTLGAIVVSLVGRDDSEWFDLDDRARAIVAIIDGELIVEEILAATHTPIPEGIELFAQLARLGIVGFRAP
jgi:hypothetical protein